LLRDIFELLWIFSSILTIHLLTLIDRHSFTQRCNEASEAKKIAAQETKLRINQQRFLSMLMHEIRTPLSVIKISTDMIIQDAPAINEKQIWVERIDVAIDNITQVIENCVQAEKHEEGLIKPQITRFLVEQELADMSSQYAQANTEYASRIEVGMDASDRNWLQTDKHYLRSMLLNLLSNAVKYSPPFTKIYLRIYKVQQQSSAKMLFEIENEIGKAGAPDESQVFQRYYRAETAKKYAGTGLGLWLSQIMAKQLGTRINMDLTPQKTIRFHFTLPIVHPQ
jgi:signal transduction histidine kinase